MKVVSGSRELEEGSWPLLDTDKRLNPVLCVPSFEVFEARPDRVWKNQTVKFCCKEELRL